MHVMKDAKHDMKKGIKSYCLKFTVSTKIVDYDKSLVCHVKITRYTRKYIYFVFIKYFFSMDNFLLHALMPFVLDTSYSRATNSKLNK